MDAKDFEKIEQEYERTKHSFQKEDKLFVAEHITESLGKNASLASEVYKFLIRAFENKLRADKKTPLVFHSIFLSRILYSLGEESADQFLVGALHDVPEDTNVSEEELREQPFLKNREYITNYLKILTENKNLSREPDGKSLPPRYKEHIKRIISSPKEVINTEIIDRFCDLTDLEYITELPEKERTLRLTSKLIKTKSFVENIIRGMADISQNCLDLFNYKLKKVEDYWKLSPKAEFIS